jgi:hypothetical protein
LPIINQSWEFFCVTASAGTIGWGWRKRMDGIPVEASATYFNSFFECHQDAKRYGFQGELQFAPADAFVPIGTLPPEHRSETAH